MSEGQDIVGVIIAGGQARRMGGGDKCLLPLGHGVVLDHIIARLRPQVATLALNANGATERFAGFGVPVFADSLGGDIGPLSGILAALEWAAATYPRSRYVLTVAGDTPFFPLDLGARLSAVAERDRADIALATADGHDEPLFALWSTALAEDLRDAIAAGTRKIMHWAERYRLARVAFAEGEAAFFNINTPDDLAAAAARLGVDEKRP